MRRLQTDDVCVSLIANWRHVCVCCGLQCSDRGSDSAAGAGKFPDTQHDWQGLAACVTSVINTT